MMKPCGMAPEAVVFVVTVSGTLRFERPSLRDVSCSEGIAEVGTFRSVLADIGHLVAQIDKGNMVEIELGYEKMGTEKVLVGKIDRIIVSEDSAAAMGYYPRRTNVRYGNAQRSRSAG